MRHALFGLFTLALISLPFDTAFASAPTLQNQSPFSLESVTQKIDGSTGAFTQHVPIDIPPGRNGLQPDLSLDYNSQNTDNDNIAGYGWNLSIPYIARMNKTGSQDLYTASSTFASSMDSELVSATISSTSTASSTLLSSLVGYWKLDGNSTDSLGSNSGSDTSISYGTSTGRINQGVAFNGSASTINLGTNSSLNIGGAAFSISAWVYPTTTTGPLGIFARRESNTGSHGDLGYMLEFGNTPGKFGIIYNNSTSQNIINTTSTYSANAWYHVVVTDDGSGNITLYVNGVSAGTGTNGLNVSNTDSGVHAWYCKYDVARDYVRIHVFDDIYAVNGNRSGRRAGMDRRRCDGRRS